MKLHREITPVFYRNFKCRGDQCLSHCCRGWAIHIDKKTYKTYKAAHQIEVKDITEKYLIPHSSEQHTQHYAHIALKEDGDCPFLNPKKLCNIYLTLGPNALSRTCQTYPRVETSIQSYRQYSLSLSCPEAVRLVLFDPDALKYEEKTSVKRTKITESVGSTRREDVTQEQQIIQLFCRHLMMAHSPFIEDNLYALVQFMIFLQSLNYRVEENYPRVESLFTSLVKELTDGQIYQKRKAITTPARHHFKFSLLLVMLRFFTTTGGRSRQHLLSSVGDTMQFFGLQDETLQAAMPENWQILDDEWRKLLNDSCLAAPHVLKNYFLYQFHHTTFGLKDLSHSLRTLYYYFIDFFYLKTLLSVQSVRGRAVSEEAVQLTFSHYATVTMHSAHFRPQLDALIDKLNYGDDLSCLLLLN